MERVGIIGAWNYPLLLSLSPLVSALAAGNHAMLKPSELAPHTAELLSRLVAELFSPDYVTVVTGGPETGATFAALPFDHLLFTGSTRVGKIVMRAASEHLTPVTLELGGKSPALVHPDFPAHTAAVRIMAGKLYNAGQTCIAPDYALVEAGAREEFVRLASEAAATMYPKVVDNPDFTRIVNREHYHRLRNMVGDATQKGAEMLEVNPAHEAVNEQNRVFPPTILWNVSDRMTVMQEEIFGPVLPVVTYRSLDEAIAYRECPAAPAGALLFRLQLEARGSGARAAPRRAVSRQRYPAAHRAKRFALRRSGAERHGIISRLRRLPHLLEKERRLRAEPVHHAWLIAPALRRVGPPRDRLPHWQMTAA